MASTSSQDVYKRQLQLLIQLQNTVDIGLGRQQLFHFFTGFSVVGVGRFLLRQQLGVLGIQPVSYTPLDVYQRQHNMSSVSVLGGW